MNPYIKSNERGTYLPKNQEAVNQPFGIDYGKLSGSLTNIDKVADQRKVIEKKSSLDTKVVKDLRKTSNNEGIAKELEKNDVVNNLQSSSIIPVPGLAIDIENSGSDQRPPDSDWIASHGPQWGPMTQ